jgi:hypothetical protein
MSSQGSPVEQAHEGAGGRAPLDRGAVAARFRRRMCASILVFEALVVGFAVLVAKDLSDVSTTAVVTVGLAGMAACLLVAGLLRHRWAYAVGSALQVLLLLSGLVVPTMWFLGAVFGALWLTVLYLATRLAALPPVTR